MASDLDLEQVMETARRAVGAASAAALRHFRMGLHVERKPDASLVTEADRSAEAAALDIIRAAYPTHAVLGEETGPHGDPSEQRWIVDPIDGTHGFIRGGPYWGPLVAFERQGEILVGAMALPVRGRSYWAGRGLGSFRDGERIRVSAVADWASATLSVGELKALLAPPHGAGVQRLVDTADRTRCLGDLAGCAMLLDGLADVWLEAGVSVWDLAPLKILVEEAGGRFTDLGGTPTHAAGSAVASNGLLHDHVLAALRGEG